MRDSQRQAVYNWERGLMAKFPSPELTLAECTELVNRVWRDYRPDSVPPKVLDGRGRSKACGSRWQIKLPRWARRPIVVLHEVAHALLDGKELMFHGREFAMLVLELWNRYAGVPRDVARAAAIHQKPRRVRFAVAAAVPRRPCRVWVKWRQELTRLRDALREHEQKQPPKY